MQQTDREWAKTVLGLEDPFTSDDLDRVTANLTALWTPHAESTLQKAQAQGKEELDKIERARQILIAPEAEKEGEPTDLNRGLQPAVLGVLISAAFIVGFGGMYLYRATHRPAVSLMIPNTMLASRPKVRLDAPDVSVSSRPLGYSSTQNQSQADSDEARVNEDLAGLGGDDPGTPLNDLRTMGARAVPGLTAALSSNDSDTRKTAAATINLMASNAPDSTSQSEDAPNLKQAFSQAKTVDALGRLVDDDDSETRQAVAEALGNIADPSGLDSLVSLSTDSEPDVRSKVADSIAKMGDNDGISTLSALLDDAEASVRISAAQALGHYVDIKEAHSALTDRLAQESDDDVKKSILAALGLSAQDERNL
jgi:hypothetical protein